MAGTRNWADRFDAPAIKAEILRAGAAVGLDDSDAVLDAVSVTAEGFHSYRDRLTDAVLAEIGKEVRRVALVHPEHVRDPAALKLSPVEAHAHFRRLVAEGRTPAAQAFQAQHREAVEIGRAAEERARRAVQVAERQRESRLNFVRSALRQAQAASRSDVEALAHLAAHGTWPIPPGAVAPVATPPPAWAVAETQSRLAKTQAEVARLEAEEAALLSS